MTHESGVNDSHVSLRTSDGLDLRGGLLHLNRYEVAFEIYNPQAVLRASEVLSEFRILVNGRIFYSGNAVLSTIVNSGTMLVCQAKLEESRFVTLSFAPEPLNGHAASGFGDFLKQWQRIYKVLPEFKVVVADMQTFLTDLRLWLDQVELQVRSAPSGNRLELEQKAVQEICAEMVPAFDAMHERLEDLSGTIEDTLRPVHQNFCKRLLHPLLLCSPFAYRTFNKPLGYAGDYEMVNMITRDPHEGGSVFAKAVNRWFLSQWPAKAHRNRIAFIKSRLSEEGLRLARINKPLRVLNLGCGPAREIQEFLADSSLSDISQFTLLDFNEETIQYTSRALQQTKERFGRRAEIHVQRKSVQQILKESAKPIVGGGQGKYDLVYCAGLFDYLSDRICKQLMGALWARLAPGGLLLATNADDCKPFRHMLEFVLDWHLIYRNEKAAAALLPDGIAAEDIRTIRDQTAVNLFIEVRKSSHE